MLLFDYIVVIVFFVNSNVLSLPRKGLRALSSSLGLFAPAPEERLEASKITNWKLGKDDGSHSA